MINLFRRMYIMCKREIKWLDVQAVAGPKIVLIYALGWESLVLVFRFSDVYMSTFPLSQTCGCAQRDGEASVWTESSPCLGDLRLVLRGAWGVKHKNHRKKAIGMYYLNFVFFVWLLSLPGKAWPFLPWRVRCQ